MEPFLQAPPLNVDPGPEYADEVRRFQGIPSMDRAPNGRLWATWYGGGSGEGHLNYVMLATSEDGGPIWSGLKLVIDPDREGPVRAFDPCLWCDPEARLWLFWAQGYAGHSDERAGVWCIVTEESSIEHPTLSSPRRISDGIMLNKPTVLSTGVWLLPVALWGREGSSRVVCSKDNGTTWTLLGQANIPEKTDRNADEPMILECKDGHLWMLVRTTYGIGESLSADGGGTWTEVAPSLIQHTTSRFFVRRLRSGKVLLVKHGPLYQRTGRSHLTAYLSGDDGRTWYGRLMLDEREGVSYPDGVQGPDGTIYVIYDYDRTGAKQILMVTFTEEDVAQGAAVSAQARFRMLVNQAGTSETKP